MLVMAFMLRISAEQMEDILHAQLRDRLTAFDGGFSELAFLLLDHANRTRNTVRLRHALLPRRLRGLQRAVERQGRVITLVRREVGVPRRERQGCLRVAVRAKKKERRTRSVSVARSSKVHVRVHTPKCEGATGMPKRTGLLGRSLGSAPPGGREEGRA